VRAWWRETYAQIAYWAGLKRLDARSGKLAPWEVREELAMLDALRTERLARLPKRRTQ